MGRRICENCGGGIPQGRRSDAKYCSHRCGERARGRRYEDRHPDKVKANRVKQNSKNERRILARIKSRAKREDIPFNLTLEDIIIPDLCPVLGIAISADSCKGSGFHNESASVDRIDPSKGYTKGNIRIISARANLLKNNATSSELWLVYQDLRRIEDESD